MTSILPPDHPPIKAASEDADRRTFWHDAGRWICAGAIVLAAHAAGAYVVQAMRPAEEPHGAEVAAMVVEFAPEPMAPVEEQISEVAQAATSPEEAVEPEPVKEPEPEPEPVQEQPVEETVPDVVEAPKPEVVLPKQVKKPVEKPVEKTVKKVEKPKPEKPKRKVEKQPSEKAEKARETKVASAPSLDANSGPRVAANRQGANNSTPGVNTNRWNAILQAHMARNVRFLQRKAGGKAKGLVRVQFVIDPTGNVLSARLAGTSGDPTVDKLAVEAAHRASPVPAPPPAMARARLSIVLPLRFQ
ncbi:energy transducer TonB [Daeguia caeni]|uniref:Energy transducer TonB n=1 Tax=Daeguia caeni TaxID=439612 RepID=A0ABV9HA15_9HYPH